MEPAGGNLAAGDLDWGSSPKVNISVKASAMDSRMSARALEYSIGQAKERLRPILRRAMAIGAFVNLDMEHQALKSLTLALYRSLMEEPEFHGYQHTGIAMQAYLRDTDRDVADLIGWAREHRQQVTVRARSADGGEKTFPALVRIDNLVEIQQYWHGGILPMIVRRMLGRGNS